VGISQVLRKLETRPGDRWLVATLAGGLVLLIVSIVLFIPYFEILSPSGYSIVDQQTVFTYEANEKILAAWKAIDGGIHASLMCAYIDLFPFMPAYAAVIFAWGLLVARRFSGKVRTVGVVGSLCIFPAWLADIVETSIQAIISLRVETYSPDLVPIMSTAAVIKTVLFRAAVLWCVLGIVSLLVRGLIRRLRPAGR
jgi:hypothetical protein